MNVPLISIELNVREIYSVVVIVVVIDIEYTTQQNRTVQTKTCSTDKVGNIYYETTKRIFVFGILSKRSHMCVYVWMTIDRRKK